MLKRSTIFQAKFFLLFALALLVCGCENSKKNIGMVQKNKSEPDNQLVLKNKLGGESNGSNAEYELGLMYFRGTGVPGDMVQAFNWIKSAAEEENSNAQIKLGLMYLNGDGCVKNFVKATEWFQKSALLGDAYGHGDFLWNSMNDSTFTDSPYNPIEFALREAEKGDVDAQRIIGAMYLNGDGIESDLTKGFEWTQKAAVQGDSSAQNNLGNYYRNKQNESGKAIDWYQNAVAQRNAYAEYNLGRMLKNGLEITTKVIDVDGLNKSAIDWLKSSSEKGDSRAQKKLGDIYLSGEGIQKDLNKSFELYRKAALQGNVFAKGSLGRMYFYGYGTQKDTLKAYAWIEEAAEENYDLAQITLGWMYSSGEGVPKNPNRSFELIQNLAMHGNFDAMGILGWKYFTGDGVEKNTDKAFSWFLKSANEGNAVAQSNLGLMYAKGDGVFKDYIKSIEWYIKASSKGFSTAQNNLQGIYFNENIPPKDLVKAIQLLQNEADNGKAYAQTTLGYIYAVGKGVPKNSAKALEWLGKAAEQGNAQAEGILGWIYDNGAGVNKDSNKAAEWTIKSATQGYAPAESSLGAMYKDGDGVLKDSAKAVEWFQKAAVQGDLFAQGELGNMYGRGDGIPMDLVLAFAWSNLGAVGGSQKILNNRNMFEARLSPEEKTEAQRLSSTWKVGTLLSREVKQVSNSPAVPIASTSIFTKHSSGTAFIVNKEGYAVTNHHVVTGCNEVRIEGRDGEIKVISSDSVNDLAILKLSGSIADSAKIYATPTNLRQGEEIAVYGFPLNTVLSSGGNFTPGIVSALTGLGNNTNQIQITAPIQPGSSGSSVLNKKGEVVGVVSMKLSDSGMARATGQIAQNVNFAVNGATLIAFLDQNKINHTNAGFLTFEKNTADLADEARKWTVLVECWK